MTIKDFLLARIAEDEEKGRALQGYTDYFIEEFGDRLLAECAAKRAIVEGHAIIDDWQDEYAVGLRDDTLKTLAAVYADHPDYRSEWSMS